MGGGGHGRSECRTEESGCREVIDYEADSVWVVL